MARQIGSRPDAKGWLVKPPAPVRVRAEWMRLCPGQSSRFWGLVGKRVKERKVRTTDLDGVRTVIEDVRRELGGREQLESRREP